MLQRWIYEGELEDPFGEFFVACDPNVLEEDSTNMQPTFISTPYSQKGFIAVTVVISS